MSDDIPGFERDPEIEELLDEDVLEMDEDTRQEVQLYKSRLLQARRDADMSTGTPPWAEGGGDSPETDDSAEDESNGEEPSAEDDSVSEDTEEEEETTDADSIPGFEPDPELEELLEKDIQDIDEDKRVEVQKYRSRKMKARQQAEEDGDESETDSERADDGEQSDDEQSQPSESSEEGQPSDEDIDFEEDPEMEELLDEDIMDLDEETRVEVQKYKSQKMKAKRKAREDADDSGSEEAGDEQQDGEESKAQDSEKAAPPPDDQKRHDGERKIKDIVESRTAGRDVSRRGFLSSFGLGMAGFLSVLGIGGAATGRYFFPNVMSNPPEQFVAGDPTDYPTNTVSDEFKSQYRVWIVNLGDRIVGINAICTHLGCTPNWLDGQGIFKCPCHGSGYYMSGVNFEGPAPRPMDRVGIRLNPSGKIVVDKSMKFSSQATPGWEAQDAFIPV